jgi:hypothetical protein
MGKKFKNKKELTDNEITNILLAVLEIEQVK